MDGCEREGCDVAGEPTIDVRLFKVLCEILGTWCAIVLRAFLDMQRHVS